MKYRLLVILIFAVQIGFGQIYIDSYRFAQGTPLIVTDNLIGHYDIGNSTSYPGTGSTVFDLTSPQENISLFGATYNAGGYFSFDGTNDYGSLSGTAFNSFSTYTIEIISSIDGSADNFDGLVMKNTTNSWDDGIGVFYNSNQLNHFINNYTGPVSGYTIGATEPLSQLVFTYDGTALRTYQNGSQVASTNTTASINNSSSAFLLFARAGASGSITGFLGGKIYALRIYNDALSASEVLQNYNATKTRYFASGPIWSGTNNAILDDYSGAEAAYSIRALSSTYTGPLMQVRRADNGATYDIYALADGNLDETWIANVCSGTTCTVQTWYDQSGNGNNATQSTPANQPTIYTSGAVTTINGIPAILWPNYTNAYGLRSNAFNISQPNTIFSAIYFNGTSGRQDYVFDAAVTTNRHFLLHLDGDNTWYSFAGSLLSESSADLTARKLLFTQLYNTSASFVRKNAAQTANGNTGTMTMNGITIGNFSGTISSNFNHSGSIFEIIIYPTNRTDFSLIENNINSYYSIY